MAIYNTIAFLFLISAATGEVLNCSFYNFDDGLDSFQSSGTLCDGVPSWVVGNYSEIAVEQPNSSDAYIYSVPLYSCSSSFLFPMAGGVVEADVYFLTNNSVDALMMFVMMTNENGPDSVVATNTVFGVEGWTTVTADISSFDSFTGYVAFYATTTEESSLIIVDSFRFIPNSLTREDCYKLEAGDISTEIATESPDETTFPDTDIPTTDIPEITPDTDYSGENPEEDIEASEENAEGSGDDTESSGETIEGSGETIEGSGETIEGSGENIEEGSGENIDIGSGEGGSGDEESGEEGSGDIEEEFIEEVDRCVTYNFEENFDLEFTHDNEFCQGFLTWQLGNYTDDLAGPTSESHSFIFPSEGSSCVASNIFFMSPNGQIEANVYMRPSTTLDHIIILVQRLRDDDMDAVVGFNMYYPENTEFVEGWNVLTFKVSDFDSFHGYIIFFGSGTEESRVLVDSVRYIPPTASSDDEDCAFY